jgi:hypothetical protein
LLLFCLDFLGVFIGFQARIQSKIDPSSSKLDPLIKIREFWVCFIAISFVPILVLQWWFCNKLGFGDFGVFSKLEDQRACF